ncbi:hypothetical protein AB205_0124390, partial [Aquarana catesbeiana]
SDIYIQSGRKWYMTKALKRSVGHFVTLVASSGTLPAAWDIQTSTWIQGPDSKRGEVQIPATMEEEFRRRLREMQIQHRGPVSEQVLLGWFDSIRCELWKEALAREQRHQGKVLPSIQESWMRDTEPSGGLGLLYLKLTGDPNFGSDLEWWLDEIMDFREGLLNVLEVHWALEDIDFLGVQEWELEIAYRWLLDSAQRQGWAPFAWDYQEIPVYTRYQNSEILAEESARWHSNSVLCPPAPTAMDAEV